MTYKALSMIEQVELQKENAELKAHVERLRNNVSEALCCLAQIGKRPIAKSEAVGFLNEVMFEAPAQSLADHCAKCTSSERSERDRSIAEKVRERCAMQVDFIMKAGGGTQVDAIRNLSIDTLLEE